MNASVFSALIGLSLCSGACDTPNDLQLIRAQAQEQNTLVNLEPGPQVSPFEAVDAQNGTLEAATGRDSSTNHSQCHDEPWHEYAYVLAPGGLYLRAHNNLHSERLSLMPFGAKIKVIQKSLENTMTVSGIPGTMYGVQFNEQSGYAFSGYLGPYAPPLLNMNAAQYSAMLQADDPDSKSFSEGPQYTRSVSQDLTAPSISETLHLPELSLSQAYLIAQRLFGIPEDLKCPGIKGPEHSIYPDKKPKKGIWKSELAVRRADGQILEMTYVYRSKNFMRRVHLAPRDRGTIIQAHEASIL